VDDFRRLATGRIGNHRFPRPQGWNLLGLFVGKAVFVGWAVGLPLLVHPWWVVLLFFVTTMWTLGVTPSLVFQLAHCVEEADFPAVRAGVLRSTHEWAVHQVRTTVDFGQGNRLLSWYLGGLNFQIEHHLFPHIAHVHYPALAGIVEATCADFGVCYGVHAGLAGALASHVRFLRRLGRPVAGARSPAPVDSARGISPVW
jgi:linoleoyl-CoA desaturase